MRYMKAAMLICVAGATGTAHAAILPQATLDTNLIVNGNAEAQQGKSVFDKNAGHATGWTAVKGSINTVTYSTVGISDASMKPADGGSNVFSGEWYKGTASAKQMFDLSNFATEIDAGQIAFDASGWFGGYSNQNDHAYMTVDFIDVTGMSVKTYTIGAFKASDRQKKTGLMADSIEAVIESGTRAAIVTLEMVRDSGSHNDGYADNLSFAFSTTPAPGSVALLAMGLCPFAKRSRSRAQRA